MPGSGLPGKRSAPHARPPANAGPRPRPRWVPCTAAVIRPAIFVPPAAISLAPAVGTDARRAEQLALLADHLEIADRLPAVSDSRGPGPPGPRPRSWVSSRSEVTRDNPPISPTLSARCTARLDRPPRAGTAAHPAGPCHGQQDLLLGREPGA
jgi:hypothetical protein